MAGAIRLGVDLGGSKIEAAALDAAGSFRARRRVATPRGDYAGTMAAVAALLVAIEGDLGLPAGLPVGIGIPGAVAPGTGLVKNANSTWLNGRPFARDLAERLARPVRLANDANCFTLSEAVDGAGCGCPVVFGVIVGTGCGGGIAIDARPLQGLQAIAGEWGHNPLPAPGPDEWPGPACYCGRRGCIETFLSGPALSADYARHSGRTLSALAIAQEAAAGDPAARATIDRWLDRFARALAGVINILDPDMVVLGGGLSNVDGLAAALALRLPPHVFSDSVATPIRPALHGDSSGVRGAAWLWPVPGAS